MKHNIIIIFHKLSSGARVALQRGGLLRLTYLIIIIKNKKVTCQKERGKGKYEFFFIKIAIRALVFLPINDDAFVQKLKSK